MGYPTGNSLTGNTTLSVTLPDDVYFKAAVVGSIAPLGDAKNWEQYGSVTPLEAAATLAKVISGLTWIAGFVGVSPLKIATVETSSSQPFGTSATKPTWGSVVSDPDGLWNATGGYFIVPSDGLVFCRIELKTTVAPATLHYGIAKNPAAPVWRGYTSTNGQPAFIADTIPVSVSAGDRLEFWLYGNAAASINDSAPVKPKFSLIYS